MYEYFKDKIKEVSSYNFVKYFLVGVIATIITTAILWYTVEVIGLLAVVVSPILGFFVFFLKYFLYKKSEMLTKRANMFLLYAFVWVVVTAITAGFLWVTVDTMQFSVIIMNPLIVTGIFFLRFYLFRVFKMVN